MEQNDKKSIIIASIFLVILFGCLGFVIFVKMTHEPSSNNIVNDENINNNNNNNSILLTTIINDFNISRLANEYQTNNNLISMSVGDDASSFNISYTKDNNVGTINGTYMQNILSLKLTEDELQNNIIKEAFKEIANISCKYNGYEDGRCDTTIDKFFSEGQQFDGITYQEINENEKYLRIKMDTKINIIEEEKVMYKFGDFIDVNSTDYTVSNETFTMTNIKLEFDIETNVLKFAGNISNVFGDNSNIKLVIKLYDNLQSEIDSSEFSILEMENNFDANIEFTDNNIDVYQNLKYLTIEIINE